METLRIDKERKHRFFYFSVGLAIPVTIGFAILDYFEGQIVELILDLAFTGVLFASFMGLRKFNTDVWVYRIGAAFLCLIYLYATAVGSGNGTILYWIFVMPLVLFFFLGKSEGMIWLLVFSAALAILLIVPFPFKTFDYTAGRIRFLLAFVFVAIVAYGLEASRYHYSKLLAGKHEALRVEKQRLETAISEIKHLSGLLPICANCKKIRDDDGYWQDVAVYIRDHSDADFSHGICPDCVQTLYPQIRKKDG